MPISNSLANHLGRKLAHIKTALKCKTVNFGPQKNILLRSS